MNKYLKNILLICLSTIVASVGIAQQINRINLNVDGGLPSNNVYSVITDKNNYLWIATDNGVARYSGNELKIFSTEQGLPTNDVWQLLEDTSGRIWLGCIADKMGYILNEQYKPASFAAATARTIYPNSMRTVYGNMYFSTAYLNNTPNPTPYIAHENNVHEYNIYSILKSAIPELDTLLSNTISYTGFDNNGIGYYIIEDYIITFAIKDGKATLLTRTILSNPEVHDILKWGRADIVNGYVIVTPKDFNHEHYFYTIEGGSGKTTKINLADYKINEKIIAITYNPNHGNNIFIAITEHHVIEFAVQNGVNYKKTTSLASITGIPDINGSDVLFASTDPFWGYIVCTKNKGLFITPDTVAYFNVAGNYLHNYRLSGLTADGRALWMDKLNYKLMVMQPTLKYSISGCTPDVLPTLPLTEHTILVQEKGIFFDDVKNIAFGRFDNACKKILPVRGHPGDHIEISNISLSKTENKEHIRLDADRYIGLCDDPARNIYWANTKSKIVLMRGNRLTTLLTPAARLLSSHVIEKLDVDPIYGNVFIKTDGKLFFFDYEKDTIRELMTNYSLKEASFYVVKNKLVVYGRFGLSIYSITGKGSIAEDITYHNIKNSFFNTISDVFVGNDSIIVNTDKGVYTIPKLYPSANQKDSSATLQTILYYYHNNIYRIKTRDTIRVNKDAPNIRFDIVNPMANGRTKYALVVNGVRIELNSNEYTFPTTWVPDNYYTVTLYASDRVWRSNPIELTIYIQPKWYQTRAMVRIFWVLGIAATLLLIVISAFVTRRMVIKANQKRTAQMELELKSIYAQINPHFIFNSLNSALLLVSKNRMEEAYNHISKFSRLLRSYIKSSRNKYILLADEVKNLTNYIDLQQTRFKEKFTYRIEVDERINATMEWIPSLLLQPFVENAIEHGLLTKAEMGNLNIRFERGEADNQIICTIEDDGIGRQESKQNKVPNPVKEDSYGELLIKDLVSIFNKYEHMRIQVSYVDKSKPLTGTIVTIKIDGNEPPEV